MGTIELAGTWRTTATAEDVWAVVVDLRTWPRWWPAIDEVELRAGDQTTPEAARFVFGTPTRLPPLRIDLQVRDLDAPRWMVVEAPDSAITGRGTLEVQPDGDGSETRFEVSLRVRSRLLRPVERILANATRGSGKERLRQAGDDLARLAGGEPREHDL